MTRFLRAWGWLRWRTFMNAIERSGRADRIARFSRAVEALGPVMMAVMMVPSALVAMGLGVATGYGMGSGAPWGAALMHAMRMMLFVVVLLTILGPIVLPSGRGIASLTRLLLLPVSHKALFTGEVLGGLAEPWTLLGTLSVLMVPVGALIAGNVPLAAVSLIAGLLLAAALLATGALFGALLHVLMRDRRRGEWIVVLFFTLIPLAAMAPAMIAGASAGQKGDEWEEAFESRMEAMLEHPANGALVVLPGELFAAASARTAGISPGPVLIPFLLLTAVAGGATTGGWSIWKRTIDRGGISRGRARAQRDAGGVASSLWTMKTTGRAVAFTFLQHIIRTARGRTIVLPSIIIVIVFAGMVSSSQGGVKFGAIPLRDGFSLAVFGVVMSFLTVVQLWMNQFAIDKAGLTMLSLQPLTSSQILRGKMVGAAILIAAVSALPIVAGLVIGASVHPVYWGILALGGLSAFILLAPLAILLSAIFPKHVDMSSIGSKSNAHPLAGLFGGLLIFAAGAAPAGAAMLGLAIFKSPAAALGLTALWLLATLLLHWLLWKAAVKVFEKRRESLIAVANGR